jgi:hypothetical protein
MRYCSPWALAALRTSGRSWGASKGNFQFDCTVYRKTALTNIVTQAFSKAIHLSCNNKFYLVVAIWQIAVYFLLTGTGKYSTQQFNVLPFQHYRSQRAVSCNTLCRLPISTSVNCWSPLSQNQSKYSPYIWLFQCLYMYRHHVTYWTSQISMLGKWNITSHNGMDK